MRRGAPTRGHEACQGGTPPATTKARGQVLNNNGHRVPQTRTAGTTHSERRHGHRCQATPNPQTTNPSQEWRGTPTHTPQHPSPEWRSAAETRAQAQTHRTHRPGLAGYKRSAHTKSHSPNPSQDWRGTAETRAEANTHRIPQPGLAGYRRSAYTKTHNPIPQRGMAGRSGNPSPSPHPHSTPQPGVAGYRRSAHSKTHNPKP